VLVDFIFYFITIIENPLLIADYHTDYIQYFNAYFEAFVGNFNNTLGVHLGTANNSTVSLVIRDIPSLELFTAVLLKVLNLLEYDAVSIRKYLQTIRKEHAFSNFVMQIIYSSLTA
jgi:hypothetical protein